MLAPAAAPTTAAPPPPSDQPASAGDSEHSPEAGAEPDTASSSPAAIRKTRTSQACEGCRRRKVRCDGSLPCSHCKSFNLECTFARLTKRKAKAAARAEGAKAAALANDPAALILDVHQPESRRQQQQQQQQHALLGSPQSSDGLPTPPLSSSFNNGGGVAAAAASSPPPVGRPPTNLDIEDIATNTMLLVRIDDTGHARSYLNLGASNGLHVLKKLSSSLSDGLVHYVSGSSPRAPTRELVREQSLFPPRAFATAMLRVYFDLVHPWQPFLDPAVVWAQLDKPVPDYFSLYAVLACGTLRYELANKITAASAPSGILVSRVFAERARARIFRRHRGTSDLHTIDGVQAVALLAIHALHLPGTDEWGLVGQACRMAVSMGMHTDVAALPLARAGALCLPTWSKTWTTLVALDRHVALQFGRPLMVLDEDSFLNASSFLRSPENLAAYRANLLIDPNGYVAWSCRLVDIQAKVVRVLNSIEHRRKLPFTMPELHLLLSQFRSELPAQLQFDDTAAAAANGSYEDTVRRVQSAALNMRYYVVVVSLYRPLVMAKSAVLQSPVKQQYLALLEGSLIAMLTISERIADDLAMYPTTPLHDLLTMLSICTLLIVHDHSKDKQTTRTVVGLLDRIHALALRAAEIWPFVIRMARLAVEVRAAANGEEPDFAHVDAHVLRNMTLIDDEHENLTEFLDLGIAEQKDGLERMIREYVARGAATVANQGDGPRPEPWIAHVFNMPARPPPTSQFVPVTPPVNVNAAGYQQQQQQFQQQPAVVPLHSYADAYATPSVQQQQRYPQQPSMHAQQSSSSSSSGVQQQHYLHHPPSAQTHHHHQQQQQLMAALPANSFMTTASSSSSASLSSSAFLQQSTTASAASSMSSSSFTGFHAMHQHGSQQGAVSPPLPVPSYAQPQAARGHHYQQYGHQSPPTQVVAAASSGTSGALPVLTTTTTGFSYVPLPEFSGPLATNDLAAVFGWPSTAGAATGGGVSDQGYASPDSYAGSPTVPIGGSAAAAGPPTFSMMANGGAGGWAHAPPEFSPRSS
ncbi:transcription factor [Blastocladiella emersonii ATCC 22665]|nr:transcription factor [Blastocladiella emersonii ATCC 22665]